MAQQHRSTNTGFFESLLLPLCLPHLTYKNGDIRSSGRFVLADYLNLPLFGSRPEHARCFWADPSLPSRTATQALAMSLSVRAREM